MAKNIPKSKIEDRAAPGFATPTALLPKPISLPTPKQPAGNQGPGKGNGKGK